MKQKAYFLVFLLSAFIISTNAVRVSTTLGEISGYTEHFESKLVHTFLGIPFATPPIGNLRFAATKPPKPWTGIYNATRQAPSCFQMTTNPTSEDCLYLNIYTSFNLSRTSPLKPVMVFIHGGSFVGGSPGRVSGKVLAADYDVVVVSVAYRLGMFGFLNGLHPHAPGNAGLHDQKMALRWVKQNIESFGGNPAEITIFGNSAGSIATHLHLLSSNTTALFKRAIMQSGSSYSKELVASPEKAVADALGFAQKLNCAQKSIKRVRHLPHKVILCLQKKSAEEILNVTHSMFQGRLLMAKPMYGDSMIPISPIEASNQGLFYNGDLLLGVTTHEGSSFLNKYLIPELREEDIFSFPGIVLKALVEASVGGFGDFGDAIQFYFDHINTANSNDVRRVAIDYASDVAFVCPSLYFAEKYSERNNDVYFYQLSHRTAKDSSYKWMGVRHGSELPYVFGKPFLEKDSFTDEDRQFSRQIMEAWTSFAKTGKPSVDVEGGWPKFTSEKPQVLDMSAMHLQKLSSIRRPYCNNLRKYFTA